MKAFGIGVLAAFAAASLTKASDFDDAGRWDSPKYEMLKTKWPRDAAGGLVYGRVLLDCGVGAKGYATDCQVKASEPSNPSLEQAALSLAPLYKATDPKTSRALLEVDVRYDTPPDWLHKPSGDQLSLAWPRNAVIQGLQGASVRIKCQVNKQGLLQQCLARSEDPPGWGFGDAAIQLTPTFLLKPALRDGEPVVSDLKFSIIFGFGPQPTRFQYPPPVGNTALAGGVYWTKTPVPADILRLLDKKVGDKFADGKVVLMCGLDDTTGRLVHCSVVNASSGMTEFTSVAQTLAGEFQADPRALVAVRAAFDAQKIKPVVFVPFSFPDMTSATWNTRYLSHVQWTYIPGPSSGHPLFPEEAVKAGIKEGIAAVDCTVGADGSLHGCSVTRESTPGVGLGTMAKAIAESSTINPWTEEGLPAGGAHVVMPIQMTYDPRFTAASDAPTTTKP